MKKNVFLVFLFVFSICSSSGFGSLAPQNISSEEKVNYRDVRIKKIPLAMQCWTFRNFNFFDTLAKVKELGIEYLQAYPGQPLGLEFPDVKFDHNLDDSLRQKVREKLKETGLNLVAYGVVDIGRTEESMRRVFEFARKMGIKTIVTEPQDEDFPLLEKLVAEYNLNIAIHNHPEPSKYARPETVLDCIKNRDERIGVCADTGHWMRGNLKPVECLRLLQGRILDVHLKDRNAFGTKNAYDVPFGKGKADIRDLLAELTLQNYSGYLTIEYENEKEVANPSPAVKKGIDYIKSVTYYQDYEELLRRWNGRYTKHGWNHYGPGHFELDEKEGILKSYSGMGLFWYSVKKFRDFILELDFKCSDRTTNSGIFLRVPDVPTSDDYIFHSFEVQINDAGEGIHKTAAVYDAEAPKFDASRKTGEWNHFKITFQGKRIKVELNGKLVIDWEAEPRGKVKDFTSEGYIGLQNHDRESSVYFRNIFIRELK